VSTVRPTGRLAVAAGILGGAIRSRRRELGWSQVRLASECSRARVSITQIEAGKQNVAFDTLIAIADALGCEPSDLLAGILIQGGRASALGMLRRMSLLVSEPMDCGHPLECLTGDVCGWCAAMGPA